MRKTDVLKTLIFWKLWYQLMKISLNFKTSCCNLKIESLMLFYYFNFSRNYEVLKSKSPSILFSLYKNRKLKVKLWWGGARERKKRAFFVPYILSKRNFFDICTLSQCIVYWIRFQNIHTFTYQKTLLYTFFCLFSKSSKAFSVSLKEVTYSNSNCNK